MNLKQNNDSIITGLPTFTLILFDGKREGELFANGNMQIGIAIDILAATGDGTHKVTLSPEQLNSIELIDKITHEKLTGDWTYSSDENDYSHTYPRGDVTRGINLSSGRDTTNDDGSQRKVYWLTTKKEETKEIIAKITLCGKDFLSDDVHAEGSHIDVHGRRAIVYDSSDLGHEEAPRIDSGKYGLKVTTTVFHLFDQNEVKQHYDYLEWIKNNYYIYPVINGQKVDVHDVEIHNTINDNNPSMYDYRRFTHHTRASNLYLWFLWGLYYEDKKIAGAEYKKSDEWSPSVHYKVLYEATPQVCIVTKPEKKKVISMSRLYFESPRNYFWEDKNDYIPKFKFHDVYGNESVWLEIIMEDADKFHFQDAE
ncbi:hypothetical protein [Xenorhabdus stockiae]|uniref:hypothetical protein n=1 Tax=Xenorhabdus stockiae TaxID=351614 RepID=UPI004063C5AB